jgi:hypothetical protein
MSFLRHGQIYQPMSLAKEWRRNRLGSASTPIGFDEFATGYSSAGCTPALPASASPAGFIFTQRLETVNRHLHKVGDFSSSRMRNLQPVLTEAVPHSRVDHLLGKEMEFERDFAKMGGTLLAGCDPTGDGSILAGFGDQREVELLVNAGFNPVEAIRIATKNGADFLGIADRVGTVAAGKQADLIVVNGDPAANIADIEKVEFVFRKGVGYDPMKLLDGIHGAVGLEN